MGMAHVSFRPGPDFNCPDVLPALFNQVYFLIAVGLPEVKVQDHLVIEASFYSFTDDVVFPKDTSFRTSTTFKRYAHPIGHQNVTKQIGINHILQILSSLFRSREAAVQDNAQRKSVGWYGCNLVGGLDVRYWEPSASDCIIHVKEKTAGENPQTVCIQSYGHKFFYE